MMLRYTAAYRSAEAPGRNNEKKLKTLCKPKAAKDWQRAQILQDIVAKQLYRENNAPCLAGSWGRGTYPRF
eukprot:1141963-Pelagomonas_calceolata.AAC.2